MVPSHRRALRARLLSFRYVDGLYLRISFSTQRLVAKKTKSWPGGPRPTLPRQLLVEGTRQGLADADGEGRGVGLGLLLGWALAVRVCSCCSTLPTWTISDAYVVRSPDLRAA